MKALLAIASLFLFSSCASYVQALHRQISQEQRTDNRNPAPQGAYQQQYRNQNPYMRAGDRRPIQNPKTLGGYPTTSNQKNVYPQVKREYGSPRVRAEDLKDNGGDGSLWSGQNSESFLFVTNNIKKPGDIVIIEVLSKLKDDITDELKRNYPDPVKKKDSEEADAEKKEPEPQVAENPANQNKADEKKVHDKISTQVVESINKDYLLLRGRKEVVFKKAKRFIEVQALVSRRDITDNDTVTSDRILEPKIRVLRY